MQTHTPEALAPIGFSVAAAARYAGVSRSTLYEWIKSGQLTVRKAGRRTIVSPDDVKATVNGLPALKAGSQSPSRSREVD